MNLFEFLKNNKVGLASIPVINYVLYILYSMIRSLPRGVLDLGLASILLPLTIIGMILLFLFLRLFGSESNVPVYTLTFFAVLSIIHTVFKMVTFKPIKVPDFKKKLSEVSSKIVDLASGKFKSVSDSITNTISSSVSETLNDAGISTEKTITPTQDQTSESFM